MDTRIFCVVHTTKQQAYINCSGSRLRSALKIAGGSFGGGGSFDGPCLYVRSPKLSLRCLCPLPLRLTGITGHPPVLQRIRVKPWRPMFVSPFHTWQLCVKSISMSSQSSPHPDISLNDHCLPPGLSKPPDGVLARRSVVQRKRHRASTEDLRWQWRGSDI